ncbi:hypothetical protein [Treponema pedis]|nr:hypothetical protein [Treponema pedis]
MGHLGTGGSIKCKRLASHFDVHAPREYIKSITANKLKIIKSEM